MKNMVDFEKVPKVFLYQGQKVTAELCTALEQKGPKRLDEILRALLLDFGDRILQTVFGEIGNNVRHSEEALPVCSCCGEALQFKQMRKMDYRSALTGKPFEIKSPMRVCKECRTGSLWMRELLDLDRDGFTQRLRELSVKAGVLEPFEPASEEIMRNRREDSETLVQLEDKPASQRTSQ